MQDYVSQLANPNAAALCHREAPREHRRQAGEETVAVTLLRAPRSQFEFSVAACVFFAAVAVTFGCSRSQPHTLTCTDTREGRSLHQESPWVLRIDEARQNAEMVVHVPAESIRGGVPEGNRKGRVLASERAYEVTIPADSGGQGAEAWSRLQFTFEVDRFTGMGTVELGERKYGETLRIPIRCEVGQQTPKL